MSANIANGAALAMVVGALAAVAGCNGADGAAARPNPERSGQLRREPERAGPQPAPERGGPEVPENARFGLHFFRDRPRFSYTYEPLWDATRAMDASQILVTVRETDVLAYIVGPAPSECIVFRLAPEVAARLLAHRAPLTERAVLVTLDGQPMYAASEYIRIGAAALRHPVVHLDRLEQRDVEMCAVLGGGANAEEASRIDRPELRELFAARGVLRESSR